MYLAALFVFHLFYSAISFIPFILIALINEYVIGLPSSVLKLAAGISLIFYFIAVYRAKLAADTFSQGNSWFEANDVSGAMLKTQLAFLPIVGKYFDDNNNR